MGVITTRNTALAMDPAKVATLTGICGNKALVTPNTKSLEATSPKRESGA